MAEVKEQKVISSPDTIENFEEDKLKPNSLKMSEEEEHNLAQKMMAEINEAIKDYDGQLKNIEKWEKLSDCIVPPRTFPNPKASNICLPMIPSKIRVAVAKFMKTLVNREEIYFVKPGINSEVKNAHKVKNFLNWVVRFHAKLQRTFKRCYRKVGRAGTCILKPYWVRETEMVRDIEEYKDIKKFTDAFPNAKKAGTSEEKYREYKKRLNNGESIEITVQYEGIKYEGVKVDVIDRKDFIVPFGIIDNQECLFNAQRIKRRWYELKAREDAGIYKNIDKLRDESQEEINQNAEYTLYEIIRKHKVKGSDKLSDCLFTIGIKGGYKPAMADNIMSNSGTAVLLRGELYPFMHNRRLFIPFRMEDGDGFDGVGIAQKLYDINIETNYFHNTRIDSLLLASTLTFKGRRNSSLETEDNYFYAGSITWVDQMGDLEQFKIVSPSGSLIEEESLMSRQAELHSGITDYASGKESPSDPRAPAAKAMMLLQETNLSINEYIDSLRDSMSELARQIIGLYFQFMPKNMKYYVTDDKGKPIFDTITRQELKLKNAEYIVMGSTAEENKYLDRQEFRELFKDLMQFSIINANDDAVRELIDRLLDKYDVKGKTAILPTVEQIKEKAVMIQKEAFKQMMEEKMSQSQGQNMEGGMTTQGGRQIPEGNIGGF